MMSGKNALPREMSPSEEKAYREETEKSNPTGINGSSGSGKFNPSSPKPAKTTKPTPSAHQQILSGKVTLNS